MEPVVPSVVAALRLCERPPRAPLATRCNPMYAHVWSVGLTGGGATGSAFVRDAVVWQTERSAPRVVAVHRPDVALSPAACPSETAWSV